ncbi:MAG: polar amino acid transport system substrate-binding protein [Sulfurimonas sp.]|jgi:polar amino acid transport system substrate-binding protein
MIIFNLILSVNSVKYMIYILRYFMKLLLFFILILSLHANEKVSLQLKWLHQFQFAGYYAAKEKGFYEDLGLDVEIRQRDLSKDNIEQVIDGEAEYGIADSVLHLYKANNKPVVIVTPIFQHSPNTIITLKSSGIDSPYKLEGKRFTFYKKDSDAFNILFMLQNLHINIDMQRERDKVTYEQLINLDTDAYTGYLTNEPFYFKQKGIDINIINPSNYGLDMYGDILFTNTKEAKKHPARVIKFKEASLKGWQYALEHKEEMIKIIKSKYAKDKSVEHLRYEADAIEEIIQYKSIPLGTLDKGRIRYTIETFKQNHLINNNIDINEYIFQPFMQDENIKKSSIFSQKEQNYLSRKKNITMCIDPDWLPFEKMENGKHIGLSAEYFKLFEKEIGIPITLLPTKTWSESLKAGQERKCDIFSLVMPTKKRRKFLDFTAPYFETPLVIVTTLDEFFIDDITSIIDKKIAIIKGYSYGEILKEKYPKMKFVEVQNIKEGLQKVVDKELFGFIGTFASAGYNIQMNHIGELKIAGKFDDKWSLSIGVRNDEPILRSIFNKAISQVSTEEKQEFLTKWISVNYDKKVDYTLILASIAGIVFLFISILFIVLRVNSKLKKEIKIRKETEKKLQEISITDELTTLYNRRYFNEIFPRLINSAKRENLNICFAVMDIDYFKAYNDTYGHVSGDNALKSVALSLKRSLSRADDYCFRLGGEEFGILFKGLNKEQSIELIERVKQDIENLKIVHEKSSVNKYLTASFGLIITDAKSVEDEKELYKEADALLYKAKENGRNKVCVNI